uniref:Uncharacterized protein n=1 Tax=Oryza glaberrima TaxID=4538 RepID=I1NRM2_ORYGL
MGQRDEKGGSKILALTVDAKGSVTFNAVVGVREADAARDEILHLEHKFRQLHTTKMEELLRQVATAVASSPQGIGGKKV